MHVSVPDPKSGYPVFVYHKDQLPRVCNSKEEFMKLGPGWGRTYIHQEFPKGMYNPIHGEKTARTREEFNAFKKADPRWQDEPYAENMGAAGEPSVDSLVAANGAQQDRIKELEAALAAKAKPGKPAGESGSAA